MRDTSAPPRLLGAHPARCQDVARTLTQAQELGSTPEPSLEFSDDLARTPQQPITNFSLNMEGKEPGGLQMV